MQTYFQHHVLRPSRDQHPTATTAPELGLPTVSPTLLPLLGHKCFHSFFRLCALQYMLPSYQYHIFSLFGLLRHEKKQPKGQKITKCLDLYCNSVILTVQWFACLSLSWVKDSCCLNWPITEVINSTQVTANLHFTSNCSL